MAIGAAIHVILGITLVVCLPAWPHSRRWGLRPSAVVGTITVIVLVLFVTGRI